MSDIIDVLSDALGQVPKTINCFYHKVSFNNYLPTTLLNCRRTHQSHINWTLSRWQENWCSIVWWQII